jgi:predicted lipid-binding transport protein (Tim44 family)
LNPKLTSNNKEKKQAKNEDSNVIELKANEIDEEIADYVELDSPAFKALSEMKKLEKGWLVSHFVSGAKMAYEDILMAFEKGDLSTIRKMTSKEVVIKIKTVTLCLTLSSHNSQN